MSAHAYTEDQRQPTIGLFAELAWQTMSASEETFGATGTLLRETKGEVVLVSRLRTALERLNPALPPEAITAAVPESCLSGWRASVATRGFPASSYLSRKRPV